MVDAGGEKPPLMLRHRPHPHTRFKESQDWTKPYFSDSYFQSHTQAEQKWPPQIFNAGRSYKCFTISFTCLCVSNTVIRSAHPYKLVRHLSKYQELLCCNYTNYLILSHPSSKPARALGLTLSLALFSVGIRLGLSLPKVTKADDATFGGDNHSFVLLSSSLSSRG